MSSQHLDGDSSRRSMLVDPRPFLHRHEHDTAMATPLERLVGVAIDAQQRYLKQGIHLPDEIERDRLDRNNLRRSVYWIHVASRGCARIVPTTWVVIAASCVLATAGAVDARRRDHRRGHRPRTTRFGAYGVAAWLVRVIVNLIIVGGYLDVSRAARYSATGLVLGALTLARLSLNTTNSRARRATGPSVVKPARWLERTCIPGTMSLALAVEEMIVR